MTELSPAAQVMIAVTHVYQEHGGDPPARAVAAAVLRAAALHAYSEEYETCGGASYALMIEVDDLLAIATELEAQQ